MSRNPNFYCEVCGKPIYRNPNIKRKHVTCSKECLKKLNIQLNHDIVTCEHCGKSFHRKKSRNKGRIYCSDECFKAANPFINREKVMKLHYSGLYDHEIANLLGCSRPLISKIVRELISEDINRRSKKDNTELRLRISRGNQGKRTGKENHKFKGKSKYTSMARGVFSAISKKYMLKKDYTCECCGKRGGNLNVHHLKQFSVIIDEFLKKYSDTVTPENFTCLLESYKDFMDEGNLKLLCVTCHKKVHYGG